MSYFFLYWKTWKLMYQMPPTDTILEDHEVRYKRKMSRAEIRWKKFISSKGYLYAAKVNLYQISEHVTFLFKSILTFSKLFSDSWSYSTTIGDIALTSGVRLLILSRETIFCAGLLTISARQKQVFSSGKQKQQMYNVHFTYLN